MKKASLTTAFVLVLAIAVVAQTTTPGTATTPGTTAQGQTTPGANPTSLTGCLSGPTNGVYTLRTLTDNRVYTLRSENPLASHASRAVTVTGSLDASANATTATSTTAGTGANAASPSNPTAAGANAGTNTTASDNINATGAATSSGNVQAVPSAPVFTVTNISMANESCEAGSAAIGTGTPTTSAAGVTATGQSTTTNTMSTDTASQVNPPPATNQTASGQTSTTDQTATGAGTSATAGAEVTDLSGCLMASNRDAGRYFIRTAKGRKFVTEVIPDATLSANIAEHVGHRVRLTGQFSTAAAHTTMAQAGDLPQADQPEPGKKAHEQDRNTGRQFTASNIEMISASGCPQSSTTPHNNDQTRQPKGSGPKQDEMPKK